MGVLIAIVLIWALLFAILCYYVGDLASQKGHSRRVGLLCFLLGPFALSYVAALPDMISRQNQEKILMTLQTQNHHIYSDQQEESSGLDLPDDLPLL